MSSNNPIPGPIGYSVAGGEVISQGQQACTMAAQLLATGQSLMLTATTGAVELRPGAVWDNQTMLIFASPTNLIFTRGEQLCQCSPQVFLNDYLLQRQTREINRSPVALLLQNDADLLGSMLLPWYQHLRMDVARTGIFFARNRVLIEMATSECSYLLQLLLVCRFRFAKLFTRLPITSDAGLVMESMPFRVTRADVLSFIARLLGDPSRPPDRSIGAMARIIGEVAELVMELDKAIQRAYYIAAVMLAIKIGLLWAFPAVGALWPAPTFEELRAEVMKRFSQQLVNYLVVEGCDISEEEATEILEEILKDTCAVIKFQDLEAVLRRFLPMMNRLYSAVHGG